MTEQPERPQPFKHVLIDIDRAGMVYLQSAVDPYMDRIESENQSLKDTVAAKDKRIAELERQLALITEWCEFMIQEMERFDGDGSEYDGIYQANADLLERINGSMPWPDLVIETVEDK